MAKTNTPATTKKVSIATFLNAPRTANFLTETLKERKTEFVSNLIAMCDQDAKLAACDPADLMKCAMNATSLNLPLNKNLGYAYIIPYKDVPSFQIGYKGLIQLAIRTGAYKYINAVEIREDELERNKITGELKFLGDHPDNDVVGYVAYLELLNGFKASLYMSEDQIEAHALRFSKMYQSDKQYKTKKSKWSDPDARPKMSLKTVLKGLLGTYGLMTTDMQTAFESDNEHAEQTSGARFEEAEVIPQNEPAEPGNGANNGKVVDLSNL
ncbi:recombinase RecT [Carboxylicivirga sediminis]|uniref:Recombinase RecT n=1 Tax=Carboxylicivirga sediminis TaxID=2006564 RepID=A0A941IWR5_9BACT|nr:recombinase RecT [Carboxylicivirga sediminis]MBR8535440.1 recombinase RecT [Carboxylicivirga sediminis]